MQLHLLAQDVTPATPEAAFNSADNALHLTAAFAGFMSYAMMVGTIVWGVFTATNLVQRSIRKETLYGGHMTMAIAALTFAVTHAAGNVFRPAANISVFNATIPFFGTGPALATGVISLELGFVTAMSLWFQRRLGYRTWQTVHWLGYPTYGFAILHTIMAGSDIRQPLIILFLVTTFATVLLLVVLRALPSTSPVREGVAVLRSR